MKESNTKIERLIGEGIKFMNYQLKVLHKQR